MGASVLNFLDGLQSVSHLLLLGHNTDNFANSPLFALSGKGATCFVTLDLEGQQFVLSIEFFNWFEFLLKEFVLLDNSILFILVYLWQFLQR